MGLNPKGRNWGAIVNWDSLGKAYAGLTISWTILLCAGIIWLVMNRRVPFIKMRNLPLAIASTAFLHVYLVKIMLAYTTNGHFLCSAEFWIMSIYLPFGIALFQANITQLRSISHRQIKLLTRQMSDSSLESAASRKKAVKVWRLWMRWRVLSEVDKSYVLIGAFMLIQVVMTGALYATSPVLQGDWSSFGPISHAKGQAKCRKTLEWIPSAFWQLFWSWVYGPYVLYKIRDIRDAHHWRLQTVLSIISGLPGTPLWIASVFSLAFKPVNPWFVPPMWLTPGIVVMQFCTVFFPIYEYYEHKTAVHAIWDDAQWEKQESRPPPHSEASTTSLPSSQRHLVDTSMNKLFQALAADSMCDGKELYRMAALEKALLINPTPLLHFAATKDFTAENIIFLLHVKQWRGAWKAAPRHNDTGKVTAQAQYRLFNMALDIFASSVSDQTAEFPINLEGPTTKALATVFGPHMPSSRSGSSDGGSSDTDTLVDSWDMSQGRGPRSNVFDMEMTAEGPKLLWPQDKSFGVSVGRPDMARHVSEGSSVAPTTPDSEMEYNDADKGNQPPLENLYPDIDEHVFDEAEASIKYLVLTNTWRKFVKAREDAMEV